MSNTQTLSLNPAPALAGMLAPTAAAVVDTGLLRTLVGYNARRAWQSIVGLFMERMAVHQLKMIEFSVLSLIGRNPGIISSQLCSALDMLRPNMVGLIDALERRGLLERRPRVDDRRSLGLHLTPAGLDLTARAEQTAAQLEQDATARLSLTERQMLIWLLQKIYD